MLDLDGKREALCITVVQTGALVTPHFRALARDGKALSRKLWPRGGVPKHVTFHEIRRCHIAHTRRSGERIVALDLAHAAKVGPWPSGSSLRTETAVRLAREDELARDVEALGHTVLDDVILEARATSERTSVDDLLTTTANLFDHVAGLMDQEPDVKRRFELATTLSVYMDLGVTGLASLLWVTERDKALPKAVIALGAEVRALERACRELGEAEAVAEQ